MEAPMNAAEAQAILNNALRFMDRAQYHPGFAVFNDAMTGFLHMHCKHCKVTEDLDMYGQANREFLSVFINRHAHPSFVPRMEKPVAMSREQRERAREVRLARSGAWRLL
jgi:hypothetical protein